MMLPVSVGGGGATLKPDIAWAAVCAGEPLSVTLTVNESVPAEVGVPETAPVDEFMLKPAGSTPALIEYKSGGVPPLAAQAPLYSAPT